MHFYYLSRSAVIFVLRAVFSGLLGIANALEEIQPR
jgi:hypothetical protein